MGPQSAVPQCRSRKAQLFQKPSPFSLAQLHRIHILPHLAHHLQFFTFDLTLT